MSLDLEQLLREADAGARPPAHADAAELAGAVRSAARRRRRFVRVIGGASVVAAGVAFGLLWVLVPWRQGDSTEIVKTSEAQPDARSLASAMAAAAAEGDARARMVERLVRAERWADSVRNAGAADPLLSVRREQDRAAFLLVYEADRLARQSMDRARAAEGYRRVLALFPDTPSASVARERLAEIGGASRRSAADVIGTSDETKELS